jgi:hypothetical protein
VRRRRADRSRAVLTPSTKHGVLLPREFCLRGSSARCLPRRLPSVVTRRASRRLK